MNEKILIIICLLVSVIGILIMFLANRFFGNDVIEISSIKEKMNSVNVKGTIVNLETSKSGTTFIRLEDDSGIINIVIFKNSIEEINDLKKGEKIIVQGKPENYEGSLELIATKITKANP